MNEIFASVNQFFEFIVPISDFFWEFPTNLKWYASIPLLGNFPFAILLLIGSGIFFTLKTGFVQCRQFGTGLRLLAQRRAVATGISPWAAFLLSSAMRVGPGNIMGVTGAISVGGPGAVFWMWVSAFFGMATAFAEAVLAQLYKEKKGDEYVGGFPFYGRKIYGDKHWVAILLAAIFILYAMLNLPSQTFHTFTALGSLADTLYGTTFERQSSVYYIIAVVLVVSVALTVFGGLKRVTAVTNLLVPVMAVVYCGITLLLILINFPLIPHFFTAVIGGAFQPDAMFGGAFGIALAQGIKRGLMSNEAGQGTITMAAAVADAKHPCEQGFIQAIGVFLDTMIICSMTAFVVVMAQIWTGDAPVAWDTIKDAKLTVFLLSIDRLVPYESLVPTVRIIIAACYALFAFTTLLGMILFAEISANSISRSRHLSFAIRAVGALFFVPFGALIVLSGLELGNVWYIVDFTNIMVVYANVPILLIGSNVIMKTLDHYNRTNGAPFRAADIGIDTSVWNGDKSQP